MKEFKIRASACGSIMGKKGLGQTGLTYCETWLKEQLYSRKKEFSNKYTQKGNIVEDNSLDYIAEQLGFGMLLKNERHYENEFMTGTPDVVLKNLIIDVKNSWDAFTFPLFSDEVPNDSYYYQAQCYMELTGIDHFKLVYVLSDTPDHLIFREAKKYCYENGFDELDQDIYDEFFNKMTYSDVPDSLKIKVFDIEKNETVIELIKQRVIECRQHISKIWPH